MTCAPGSNRDRTAAAGTGSALCGRSAARSVGGGLAVGALCRVRGGKPAGRVVRLHLDGSNGARREGRRDARVPGRRRGAGGGWLAPDGQLRLWRLPVGGGNSS